MPSPTDKTTIESIMANNHAVELQNKSNRAAAAFTLLSNYNWNSTGSMPEINWQAPTGLFVFNSSNGEIFYKSVAYSSLSSIEKREFFQYLPRFIKFCLEGYDNSYDI
jgi:hypothetical protein